LAGELAVDADADLPTGTDDPAGDGDDDDADDADESVTESGRPGAFMVNFQNTDLRLALRLLSTQGRRNIVASKSVSGTVTATFYDVTFEEALDAILRATGHVFIEEGNFIYVYTPEELAKIEQATRDLEVRAFRLSYVTAFDAQILITPVLSADGTVALTPEAKQGIAPDTTDTGGNDYAISDLMIVRDYAENLDAVADVLAQIDVRPQQVLIEATILSARLDENNALGVNFTSLMGTDFESINSRSNPGLGNTDAANIVTADAMNDFNAVEFRTGFDPIEGGLSIGILTSSISAFITALESFTDLTVLANPKLLVINKQRGEVLIGSRDGYLTTVVNEGVSTQSVEFLETGTKLIVRPYIGSDGYIRLEIHPEDSDGSVTNGLPSETTTQVTSNVLIRDGRTIVIGGLFRDEMQHERSQIPWIGNVKGLGDLFGVTEDAVERHEVIIIITTRVVQDDVDDVISEQIRDDIERFRVGQRQGLRWWGRGQLAQASMRKAKEALRQGDAGQALWHTDMALSLQPRLIEAVELKERLTEEAYWAGESRVSSIRYLLQRIIMDGIDEPVARVIPADKPLDAEGLTDESRDALGIEPRILDPLPVWPDESLPVNTPDAVKDSVEPTDASNGDVLEVRAMPDGQGND
jgi:type IV pilus assembly protein PilQ